MSVNSISWSMTHRAKQQSMNAERRNKGTLQRDSWSLWQCIETTHLVDQVVWTPSFKEADKPVERYYLSFDGIADSEREVTADEFVAAERNAGFYPKPWCGPFATSGFGWSWVRWRRAFT